MKRLDRLALRLTAALRNGKADWVEVWSNAYGREIECLGGCAICFEMNGCPCVAMGKAMGAAGRSAREYADALLLEIMKGKE